MRANQANLRQGNEAGGAGLECFPLPLEDQVSHAMRKVTYLAQRLPRATSNQFDYTAAIIQFAKWRFILATILPAIELASFLVGVQFLLWILQFLQDEASGLSPPVEKAYQYAAVVAAASIV